MALRPSRIIGHPQVVQVCYRRYGRWLLVSVRVCLWPLWFQWVSWMSRVLLPVELATKGVESIEEINRETREMEQA